MTIEELAKATGAPSAAALEAEMKELGVDAEDLAGSESYQQSLKDRFAKASALTTTQEATPAKTKGKRKTSALKATTANNAASANKAGNAQMATIDFRTDLRVVSLISSGNSNLTGNGVRIARIFMVS